MMRKYLHLWWQKYIEPTDPFNRQLKLAIKSCLVAIISIGLVYYFTLPQKLWFIFSAVFVMQMYKGDNKLEHFLIQFFGAFVMTVGVYFGSLVGEYLIGYLLLMMLVAAIAFYLSKYGPNISVPSVFVLMLILLSCNAPTEMNDALQRTLSVIMGSTLAIIVSHLIWPYRPYRVLQQNLLKTFHNLGLYLKLVMNDSLRGNFHRLRQYELKNKTLESIQACRNTIQYQKFHEEEILKSLEALFEQCTALSDVLNKPNSEFTLDIASRELSLISTTITEIFKRFDTNSLEKLQIQLKELKEHEENSTYNILTKNDIKCICFLLAQINQTLLSTHDDYIAYCHHAAQTKHGLITENG